MQCCAHSISVLDSLVVIVVPFAACRGMARAGQTCRGRFLVQITIGKDCSHFFAVFTMMPRGNVACKVVSLDLVRSCN